jgi:hypothetical protein
MGRRSERRSSTSDFVDINPGGKVKLRFPDGTFYECFVKQVNFNRDDDLYRYRGSGDISLGPLVSMGTIEVEMVVNQSWRDPCGDLHRKPKELKEEPKMDEYPKAHVDIDKRRRLAQISLEVEKEMYQLPSGETMARKPGEEMPLFVSMPLEHLTPILRAAYASEMYDPSRETFR